MSWSLPPEIMSDDRVSRRARSLLALASIASLAASPSPSAPLGTSSTPAAQPAPLPGPKKATLLRDASGRLRDFTGGRAPDSEHPLGTLFVAGSGAGTTFVAEIDLASHATLDRTQIVPEEANVRLASEGTRAYALIATGRQPLFGELSAGAAWKPLAKLSARFRSVNAFVVVAGRPIVLPQDGDSAVFLVFEPGGKLISKRNCRAGLFEGKWYKLHVRDGRVFVNNLVTEDSFDKVCAFDADGRGPVDELEPLPEQEFSLERMELTGEDSSDRMWAAPVNRRLKVGPKRWIAAEEPESRAEKPPTCDGVTGTAIKKNSLIHGVRVVHSFNCCGDTGPAGIWVCSK